MISSLILMISMGWARQQLTEPQQYLLQKTVEVAGNDTVNSITGQAVTHQECNRMLEYVRGYNMNSKDLIAVHEALREQNNLSPEQLQDAHAAISDILTVRLRMEEYIQVYHYTCIWKIKEDPRELVEKDSPLSEKNNIKSTLKPIRSWERVVVAVCGIPKR